MLAISAAAMILAAANVGARAQDATQNFELRGTDAPFAQAAASSSGNDGSSDPLGTDASGTDASGTVGQSGSDAGSNGNAGISSNANSSAGPALGFSTDAGSANGAQTSGADSQRGDLPEGSNYGRPKAKKPKLYQLPVLGKPKKTGFPPLPALTTYKSYKGGTRTRKPLSGQSSIKAAVQAQQPDLPDPSPTAAVLPILPHPPKPKPDPGPFDPLGVDVGSLRFFPYVEADTGYDSNPNLLADGVKGSSYLHGETGLKLESQWSQNSLTANLRGGYYDYFSVPAANRPDVSGTATARVDVTRTTKLNFVSSFSLSTQQPGSAQLAIPGSVFITNRPLVASFGQTAGASQAFNRLTLDLRGTFDRSIFGDAMQSDGTELLLSQNDYNTYGVVGRASYELTPGVIPFVELRGDARRYDDYVDADGFARNSNGIAAKAGTKFELTRLLTGEIAAGYADRAYVDPRLGHLKAPTLDGTLIYTATPLTTLTLSAATDLSETTVPYSSGAVSRRVGAKLAHALLRDLTVTGTASYQINQYQGVPITEYLYSLGLGADYNLTRTLVIRGSFTRQRLTSNLAGDDYTANVFLVGLKLQR
jgi:hypothetical protein